MDDDEEEDKEYPFWGRVAIATAMLGMGALAGGLIGESWMGALWGTILASPLGLTGFLLPRGLAALFVILELFSCAG